MRFGGECIAYCDRCHVRWRPPHNDPDLWIEQRPVEMNRQKMVWLGQPIGLIVIPPSHYSLSGDLRNLAARPRYP